MLAKILQKTRGKTCTCPSHKICSSCKLKKVIRPRVVVEEPRHLPAPISIKYNPPKSIYQNSPTIQYVEKSKRFRIRKKKKCEPSPPKCINLCRWYKRRKALKELIKEQEEENKRERKRRREEYENERIKALIDWEQAKQRTQSLPPPKKKPVYIKERSASAKPHAHSKYVTVKKLTSKDTISIRFVNYCYRLCCQLYCYLTCIVFVVLTVICMV